VVNSIGRHLLCSIRIGGGSRVATWQFTSKRSRRRYEKALGANRRVFLEKLTWLRPEAQAFRRLGLDFEQMGREGDATALFGWLEAVEASGVHESKGFAPGIRQDLAALTAALHFG